MTDWMTGSSFCWTRTACSLTTSGMSWSGSRSEWPMSMDELSAEEIALFLNESAEMVDTIEELLVDLEKGGDPEAIAAIFRAAHTLKGGSATAGMTNMA